MARPQSAANAGYYPTPPNALKLITNYLVPRISFGTNRQTDEYRLLDPCCGQGTALAAIAEHMNRPGLPTVRTYGLEINKERSEAAASRLTEVMNADLFHSSIGNDSFSLLFLNPPYDAQDSEEGTGGIRSELAFLQRCTQYLSKTSGVLILIVQRKFLDQRAAKYIATNYHQLACTMFPDGEREKFDQIVLFGHRKTEPYQEAQVEAQLRAWQTKPPSIEQNESLQMTVPALLRREIYFNNTSHDPWAAAAEAAVAGVWSTPELLGFLDPPETARTQPLVPLRQGHIALLTAAGFLDDKELTDDDGTHILVKGNVEKKTILTENTGERTTHQERLQITITALNLETGQFHDIKP